MAELNAQQFKHELHALLKRHGATLGVNIEGDTHGLTYDFVVMDHSENEIVIAEGMPFVDLSDLKFEKKPLTFNETYSTAGVCTNNMTFLDALQFDLFSHDEHSMIAKRPTGYFMKLYSEPNLNRYPQFTDELNAMLVEAAKQGFRSIEFDCDAEPVDGMTVHGW